MNHITPSDRALTGMRGALPEESRREDNDDIVVRRLLHSARITKNEADHAALLVCSRTTGACDDVVGEAQEYLTELVAKLEAVWAGQRG